jgi:hypothetical protein
MEIDLAIDEHKLQDLIRTNGQLAKPTTVNGKCNVILTPRSHRENCGMYPCYISVSLTLSCLLVSPSLHSYHRRQCQAGENEVAALQLKNDDLRTPRLKHSQGRRHCEDTPQPPSASTCQAVSKRDPRCEISS